VDRTYEYKSYVIDGLLLCSTVTFNAEILYVIYKIRDWDEIVSNNHSLGERLVYFPQTS